MSVEIIVTSWQAEVYGKGEWRRHPMVFATRDEADLAGWWLQLAWPGFVEKTRIAMSDLPVNCTYKRGEPIKYVDQTDNAPGQPPRKPYWPKARLPAA